MTAEALLTRLQGVLEPALGPDLLHPDYRHVWSAGNPTAGLCAVAAEAAWFVLGGPASGWVPRVARDGMAGTHWWLEHPGDGRRFDPTAAQYRSQGKTPPYERGIPGRGAGFMGIRQDPTSPWGFGRRPSERAARLLKRMQQQIGAADPNALRESLSTVEVRRIRPRTPR